MFPQSKAFSIICSFVACENPLQNLHQQHLQQQQPSAVAA